MKKPEEYQRECYNSDETPRDLAARVQREAVEACCAIHDGRFCRATDHMQDTCQCEQSKAAMKALLEGL